MQPFTVEVDVIYDDNEEPLLVKTIPISNAEDETLSSGELFESPPKKKKTKLSLSSRCTQ